MTTKPTTERNEDGELEKILESFFYAQIFDRDPDEDYVAQSVGEIKEVIKAAQSALLSRIKEEGPQLRQRKPTHGNCCTCQSCGFYHDECECPWNDPILDWHRAIDTIKAEIERRTE